MDAVKRLIEIADAESLLAPEYLTAGEILIRLTEYRTLAPAVARRVEELENELFAVRFALQGKLITDEPLVDVVMGYHDRANSRSIEMDALKDENFSLRERCGRLEEAASNLIYAYLHYHPVNVDWARESLEAALAPPAAKVTGQPASAPSEDLGSSSQRSS